MAKSDTTSGFSRRGFLSATTTTAVIPFVAETFGSRGEAAQADKQNRRFVPINLTINSKSHALALDPRTSLLDALREHVGLTGTKKGCDHGQCGACTVHINGRSVNSCLMLALSAQGQDILTIEGLAGTDGQLHPVQQAFIDHDAFQCGYCTSGQIMSGVACIKSGHASSDADIREFMSGNICRCAAYPNIVRAVAQAKTEMGA